MESSPYPFYRRVNRFVVVKSQTPKSWEGWNYPSLRPKPLAPFHASISCTHYSMWSSESKPIRGWTADTALPSIERGFNPQLRKAYHWITLPLGKWKLREAKCFTWSCKTHWGWHQGPSTSTFYLGSWLSRLYISEDTELDNRGGLSGRAGLGSLDPISVPSLFNYRPFASPLSSRNVETLPPTYFTGILQRLIG